MIGSYPSEIVRVVCAVLSPFIGMFGLYVIAHGHYGPGGGFAGGVFLAAAVILPRLTLDRDAVHRAVPRWVGPVAGGVGMLVFLLVATVPLLVGGAMLDYAALEVVGVAASRMRYLGILVVEIAVGLAVFGSILLIFDVLAWRDRT